MRTYIIALLLCTTVSAQSIDGNTPVETIVGYATSKWAEADEGQRTRDWINTVDSQGMYYNYWNADGCIILWQTTGDLNWLNEVLLMTQKYIDISTPVAFDSNYLGWRASSSYSTDLQNNGSVLFETYYWKLVATYLRIMHQSPSLMATPHGLSAPIPGTTYRDVYDSQLAFLETHIWDKWNAKGSNNIYRQNTHMTVHWARIGMEMHIITGESKYKEVFDNISFAGHPSGVYQGESLRGQILNNPSVSSAYLWDQDWGGTGPGWQDTYHLSDTIAFLVLAYENGYYWNLEDMQAIASTYENVIFLPGDGANVRYYMDGSGGYDVAKRLRDGAKIGRFNPGLSARISSQYISDAAVQENYGTQHLAISALNKFLLDGNAYYYPEQDGVQPSLEVAQKKNNALFGCIN